MPTLSQKVVRKAFKPFYPLYYRFLWGRPFPLADPLARAVRAWEDLADRGDAPLAKGEWDRQYAAGRWDFLQQPEELARYTELAGYVRRFSPGATILDIGCGEGLLATQLGPEGFSRYVGVDLSSEAIAAADRLGLENAAFVAADGATWSTGETFDVIVFNESLYYFEEPLAVANRAWNDHRMPDGFVLTSMFTTHRSMAILRRLEAELPVVASSQVRGGKGAWTVTLFGEVESR